MQRVGYASTGTVKTSDLVRIAQMAEGKGLESFWVPETRFTRDAIAPLAAISQQTNLLKLGSGVINVFTRGVVLLAMTWATLDELSNGRMILGIASGSPLILEKQGIGFHKPLKRLKEYVEVLRVLLRGDEANYEGEFVKIRGVALDIIPSRKNIPIYIGATGPKALALAARIGDGIIFNGFTSTEYTKRAMSIVRESAQSAGRTMDDIDVLSWNQLSVSRDSGQAIDGIKPLVATYLANFPNIAAESGVSANLLARLANEYHDNGVESAASLVPNSVVKSLTVAGNPDECVLRIREYVREGVKMPVLAPIASDPSEVLRLAIDV